MLAALATPFRISIKENIGEPISRRLPYEEYHAAQLLMPYAIAFPFHTVTGLPPVRLHQLPLPPQVGRLKVRHAILTDAIIPPSAHTERQ
jgi:hypothetical protein